VAAAGRQAVTARGGGVRRRHGSDGSGQTEAPRAPAPRSSPDTLQPPQNPKSILVSEGSGYTRGGEALPKKEVVRLPEGSVVAA